MVVVVPKVQVPPTVAALAVSSCAGASAARIGAEGVMVMADGFGLTTTLVVPVAGHPSKVAVKE